jgi:hypothetical protein
MFFRIPAKSVIKARSRTNRLKVTNTVEASLPNDSLARVSGYRPAILGSGEYKRLSGIDSAVNPLYTFKPGIGGKTEVLGGYRSRPRHCGSSDTSLQQFDRDSLEVAGNSVVTGSAFFESFFRTYKFALRKIP